MVNLRSRAELVIVGSGPCGIAALLEARACGLDAFAVEEGHAPIFSIRQYIEGLALLSAAGHYEVGGYPLDCRDPDLVTREELLHYYARVINHAGLEIATNAKCVGLEPVDGDGIDVTVRRPNGTQVVRASKVIVAAWYRKLQLPRFEEGSHEGLEVHYGLKVASDLAGRKVVLVGSGQSALEQAGALMVTGQAVTILARNVFRGFALQHQAEFNALVKATGSTIIENVDALDRRPGGITFLASGQPRSIDCDAIVFCIGQILDPDMLALLERAGVLTAEHVEMLKTAPTFEEAKRLHPDKPNPEVLKIAVQLRPSLWEQLVLGVRGVHLAGAAIHPGAGNSGVFGSILSGQIAVQGARGNVVLDQPKPGQHLSEKLREVGLARSSKLQIDTIGQIRPLALHSFNRCHVPSKLEETAVGELRPKKVAPATVSSPRSEIERTILERSDGDTSCSDLLSSLGATTSDAQAEYLKVLRKLWWSSDLTWLPRKSMS
jgi:thioredoxin reductase (NADPH)